MSGALYIILLLLLTLLKTRDCIRLTPARKSGKVFYELDTLDRTPPVASLSSLDSLSTCWFIPTIGGKSVVAERDGRVAGCIFSSQFHGITSDDADVRTAVYLGSRSSAAPTPNPNPNHDPPPNPHHYVALDVAEGSNLAARLLSSSGARLASLRSVADRLLPCLTDPADPSPAPACSDAASLLALAAAFTTWHAKTKFCPECGGATVPARLGNSRKCIATTAATTAPSATPSREAAPPAPCGKSQYPRIEPAVIMLVLSRCGRFTLLGRKKTWLANRYSCLAGFVEVGETLEQVRGLSSAFCPLVAVCCSLSAALKLMNASIEP